MSEIDIRRANFTLEQQVEARACLDIFNYESGEEGLLQDFQIISAEGLEHYTEATLPRHQANAEQLGRRIENFGYGRENSSGYVQRIVPFQNEPFVEAVSDFSVPRVGAQRVMIHGVNSADIEYHKRWATALEEYKETLEYDADDDELMIKKALGVTAVLYPAARPGAKPEAEPWRSGEVLQSIRRTGLYLAKVAGVPDYRTSL